MTITAILPAAATSAINVDMNVPSGYISMYYFAPYYAGAASSGTTCTINIGSTSCDGTRLLCVAGNTGGASVVVTGTAIGYAESTITISPI